ncbi:hypothetical protein [Oryzomicrobium sp.]|uniref:hypothetical protein n=1 Tax=Oryzomicrobium sp. TaxID=1911578 RepID=UPI002FE00ED9
MSGGATAGYLAAAAVAVSAYSTYSQSASADAARKQQDAAQKQAKAAADKQAQQADEAFNQANQKKADTQGALAAAQQAGKGGASGTMLTGPQGVDPSALNLGKNTLLGS